jgi:Tfp pilus assembly protein PilF
LIALAALLAIAGCSTAPKRQAGAFNQLSGDTPDVVFGTDIPVESAEEAIARADQELAMGKTDHALYHYVRALEFDPKNGDTLHKIGLIHMSKGDSHRAQLAFRFALERNPEHAGAQENLGLLLLRQREYPVARTLLEGAVRKDPQRWQSHAALGALADLRKEFDIAMPHYEAALKLNPRSAQIHNNFGYSRYLVGEWAEAEAHYRRAIQLDPEFRMSWQNLGQLQVRRGQFEEAADTFAHVITKAEAYNNVGYISMVEGNYAMAESYFLLAVKVSPSYYEIAEKNLERLNRIRSDK